MRIYEKNRIEHLEKIAKDISKAHIVSKEKYIAELCLLTGISRQNAKDKIHLFVSTDRIREGADDRGVYLEWIGKDAE